MSNRQRLFTPLKRRLLYFGAGLLWLAGIAISHYIDGISFRYLVSLTIALIICVSSTREVKLWVNISAIAIGIFYTVMWYLDHIDPSGTPDVKNWWMPGINLIFMGIYWLVQRALASL